MKTSIPRSEYIMRTPGATFGGFNNVRVFVTLWDFVNVVAVGFDDDIKNDYADLELGLGFCNICCPD